MPPVSGRMALLLLLPFEVFLTLLFLGRPQRVGLAFLPINRQPFAERVPVHPGKRTAQRSASSSAVSPSGVSVSGVSR